MWLGEKTGPRPEQGPPRPGVPSIRGWEEREELIQETKKEMEEHQGVKSETPKN